MTSLYLAIAIMAELIATSFLKISEGFSKFWPSVVAILGYGIAFYFLSLTLKFLPVGIVYAIWSGVGIVLLALVGWLVFDQKIDWAGIVGIGFIVTGVLVLNLCSKTTGP